MDSLGHSFVLNGVFGPADGANEGKTAFPRYAGDGPLDRANKIREFAKHLFFELSEFAVAIKENELWMRCQKQFSSLDDQKFFCENRQEILELFRQQRVRAFHGDPYQNWETCDRKHLLEKLWNEGLMHSLGQISHAGDLSQ